MKIHALLHTVWHRQYEFRGVILGIGGNYENVNDFASNGRFLCCSQNHWSHNKHEIFFWTVYLFFGFVGSPQMCTCDAWKAGWEWQVRFLQVLTGHKNWTCPVFALFSGGCEDRFVPVFYSAAKQNYPILNSRPHSDVARANGHIYPSGQPSMNVRGWGCSCGQDLRYSAPERSEGAEVFRIPIRDKLSSLA